MPEEKNNRRKLLAGAVAAVAAAGTASAQTAPQKKVHRAGPKPAKTPLFNSAVSYGNLVFIAGIGYHKAPNTIAVHTEGVLTEMKRQLEIAGSSMEKVLKVTVYLANKDDFAGMSAVFQGKFGDEPPVRTTIAAAWVPGDSLVEMDCIAYI
ncbi:MAG: RidA family protein [Acidobacteriia bacterium]|jgi:2-iminobutanoate/2-iminopropanoate deaminase|nr:RidA family protein [Terriglobia bacterium]